MYVPEEGIEAKLFVPVLDAAEDRMISWSRAEAGGNLLLGVSGVVDLEDMDTVWDVIEALRLRIEPAIDGLGIAVLIPLTADEAVEYFLAGFSSCDLLRNDKNWGKPEPIPASLVKN